jgi:hypothetical protein
MCAQLNPDVNSFQRYFVSEVRRCEEMERKLRTSVFDRRVEEVRRAKEREEEAVSQRGLNRTCTYHACMR